MEHHHAINGKIHYFYGHFQLLFVCSPEGTSQVLIPNFGVSKRLDLPEDFGGLLRPEQVEVFFEKRYNRKARGNPWEPRRFGWLLQTELPKMDGFWVNYNELTTSSLEIIVSKGNHPQMALIQVSELL